MRVLLIEDDENFARSLKKGLESYDITCDTTDLGEDGISVGRLCPYDVILLDLLLPDIRGTEVIKRMRALKIETPVVVISGVNALQDKVGTLEMGADDYVTKPFQIREIVARLKAVFRRSCGHASSLIRTGRLTIDIKNEVVYVDNRQLQLTEKEYKILQILAIRKGSALSKASVMLHLYNGEASEPNFKIIDVFICKLRNKLSKALAGEDPITVDSEILHNKKSVQDDVEDKDYIGTVWGRGYILNDLPVPDLDFSAEKSL